MDNQKSVRMASIAVAGSGSSSIHGCRNVSSTHSSAALEDDCVEMDEVSDNEQSEVILSIMWFGGMLGAACYDVTTAEMQIMPDQAEASPSFVILHTLLRQLEPTCVIGSSKTDERILAILRDIENQKSTTSSDIHGGGGSCNERYVYLQSSLDFAYESCKYRLQHMELPGMGGRVSEQEKRIFMATLIDFSKTCMVRAAGGLLKFLEKKRIGTELEDSPAPHVVKISAFSLKNNVAIDDNTFSALQILPAEVKPSVFKNFTGVKEGLSLYGICNRCKSFIGSREFRRWFLQPTSDLNVINKRQQAIAYFVAGQNVEVVQSLQACMRNIKVIPTILARMRKAEATLYDWNRLYKTAYNAMLIGDICRSLPSDVEIFKEISRTFTPDLSRISSLIHTVVDFDASAAENRFVVKPGVDNQLDQKKRTYNGLPNFMTQLARHELENLQDSIEECKVIYLPQLGYLLSIPETESMKQTKDHTLSNLDFMFVSNGEAYYKSASTRELDRLLGDTSCDITDDETEIMHKLQNLILEMSEVLYSVMKYCAQLDCLLSLSVVAKEFNFSRPEMSTDGVITIRKGRHPLQELCVSSFVPNDTFSSATDSKMKVVTGPNASGKSVYLKQVALIIYLAHIGSFVPAEHAKITLVDAIYSRIQITESVSVNMSGFCLELAQLSKALNNATEKSLVVIDEFGKGTNNHSGLALLAASVIMWLQKGSDCPHVFLSTHFHNLYRFLPDSSLLKFQTMETVTDKEEIVSLFRLVEGRAACSYGRNIAHHAGIPPKVLQREKEISELMEQGQRIAPRDPQTVEEQYKRFASVTKTIFQIDVDSNSLASIQQLLGISRLATPAAGASSAVASVRSKPHTA